MPCSDEHWHTLWEEFHKNPFEVLYMPRVAFEDVARCHGREPPGLLVKTPAPTAKHVQVRRDRMFEFLKAHGKECGKHPSDCL